jgi:DNA-binding NarL/FixJ family response regulator
VLKNCAADELIGAVRAVSGGATFFSNGVPVAESTDRFDLLTMRERQILQLLAEGNTNKDVAQRLSLSLHTVETHRWRIMEKLNLHNTAELVLSAVRRGMVT